jgi:DNA (cytosine-5)-methyltransferase 1
MTEQVQKQKLKIKGIKPKKLIIKSNTQLKFIDLFCGIGGFHQALIKLNAKCILACDIDKFCREVYTNNYAITPCEDVKKIDPLELEDFDIICGGFPCQAFSNAGKKKTFEDDRGLLFDEIIRIAKHKKPKFMFLENVKHILKVGKGEVIKYIKEKLDSINYNVQIFNMSPHEYGVPQQRERVYFVCVRKDIYKSPVELLTPKTNQIVFQNYLDKKEDIDDSYFLNGDLLECLTAWDEMIQLFEADEKISPTIMVNEFYKTYTKEEFKALATWRQDYITKNKPLYEKYKDQWDAWYEKHKAILSKREIYAKLEWQVGKIKPNDSIFNYFIQFRQSGIRVKKAHYFPTLVAISQIPIYGKEKRYITPKECLRLQSFPDDFKLLDGDRHAYKQLGNCVNVSNVSNVIESTLKLYGLI